MKKTVSFLVVAAAFILLSCHGNSRKSATGENNIAIESLSREEIKSRSFSDLFKTIDVKEIQEDIFTLVSQDFAILTAGNPSHYNSMVTGWGGWGILFSKPSVFSFLRSNRYTLELMRKEQRYTMTFFDSEFREDIMQFGMSSGRDSDAKMKNTQLTSVQTPDGNMTFKEAKIIIECKLIEVTTVSPDDFYTDEARKFIEDAYTETNDYHKMVFGEITSVWVRK
jgi:flavin reductase (DIM6/NTAB) family NADH-FMN oxidoreductase RutF